MFDVGFSELFIIAVVALLVLGPERLPKAARFAGLWVRKARAQWYAVKSEFEFEMAQEEMKKHLQDVENTIKAPVLELQDSVQQASNDIEQQIVEQAAPDLKSETAEETVLDLSSVIKPDQSVASRADSISTVEQLREHEITPNVDDKDEQKAINPAQGQLW